MKLRLAREGDLGALICLWQAVFGDDEAFVRAFYRASPLEHTIVALADAHVGNEGAQDEKIVGMINCPEIELWTEDERYSGIYIYALAVDRRFRGLGIASALLEAAEKGDFFILSPQFSLLIPANESLFGFYAQKGYDRAAFAPKTHASLQVPTSLQALAPASDALYQHYLTACRKEAARAAVFVKKQPIFALSMQGTTCFARDGGYTALREDGAIVEDRPASPDRSAKKALWKALIPLPTDITPLISRFMED